MAIENVIVNATVMNIVTVIIVIHVTITKNDNRHNTNGSCLYW